MTSNRIYGNRDPREIPAYPLVEAARYAGVPLSTLRAWVGERKEVPAVIELPDGSHASFPSTTSSRRSFSAACAASTSCLFSNCGAI